MSYADTQTGGRTVTAFFDSRSDAETAVERLVAIAIDRSRVRLVPGHEGGGEYRGTTNEGGFWESLKDLFLPEEDRYTYAEGLRRGGYLVSVTATDAEYERALDILDDEGTIDIDERADAWRAEGWTGYESGAPMPREGASTAYSEGVGEARDLGGEEDVIPVVEEELRIGKRDVSHGRVRIRSYVVETPVTEAVELREENVRVERRPVDRPVTGDDRLFQERTIEVEERAEEAVVAKEAYVKEELAIKKDVDRRTETVSDTVRRTKVEVEDERDRANLRGAARRR